MVESLKDKAIALRRTHILSAAIAVFGEQGFHRATIREVAQRAGVSDGSIYNSFSSKNAMLLAALDPLDEAANAGRRDFPLSKDIGGVLRNGLRQRFDALTPEQLVLHRVIVSEALVNVELRTLYLERVLAPTLMGPEPAAAATGFADPVPAGEAAFTTRAITAVVLGLVMLRLFGDETTAQLWDEIPDRLASLLLHGLAPPPEEGASHESP